MQFFPQSCSKLDCLLDPAMNLVTIDVSQIWWAVYVHRQNLVTKITRSHKSGKLLDINVWLMHWFLSVNMIAVVWATIQKTTVTCAVVILNHITQRVHDVRIVSFQLRDGKISKIFIYDGILHQGIYVSVHTTSSNNNSYVTEGHK